LTTAIVTVKGQTQPGILVNVNDQVSSADPSGNFNIPVNLDDGLNVLDIIATDDNGNQGEVVLMIMADLSQSSTISGNIPSTAVTEPSGIVPLKIIQPADGATLASGMVTVKGQTSPGTALSINDQIDIADNSGNFSIPVELVEGPNAIDVIAIDENGNQDEIILMVDVVSS
jgi:hypothetical protein